MALARFFRDIAKVFTAYGGRECILFISVWLISFPLWIQNNFGPISPDELYFHIRVPMDGAAPQFYRSFIRSCIVMPILVTAAVSLLQRLKTQSLENRITALWRNSGLILFFRQRRAAIDILILITGIIALLFFNASLKPLKILTTAFEKPSSTFYDHHYVYPSATKITFPEKRRNLVLVFMESVENSYSRPEIVGKNVMPGLTLLARENQSFTGFKEVFGTGWTIAGIVGYTCGIPLKLPVEGNSFDKTTRFLPSATSLLDILSQNGYKCVFMQDLTAVLPEKVIFF